MILQECTLHVVKVKKTSVGSFICILPAKVLCATMSYSTSMSDGGVTDFVHLNAELVSARPCRTQISKLCDNVSLCYCGVLEHNHVAVNHDRNVKKDSCEIKVNDSSDYATSGNLSERLLRSNSSVSCDVMSVFSSRNIVRDESFNFLEPIESNIESLFKNTCCLHLCECITVTSNVSDVIIHKVNQLDVASLYRVIKLFCEKFFFENDFDDLVPVIIISCVKSYEFEVSYVCEACQDSSIVLFALIRRLLNTPAQYRSAEADASDFKCNCKHLHASVLVGRKYTSSSNST